VSEQEQQNKRTIERLYEEVVNQGRLEVLDEICQPDHVEHNPFPDQLQGREGLKQRASMVRAAFNPIFTLDHVIAEGDKVAVMWTNTGTDSAGWMGNPPSGKTVTIQGVDIHLFRDGRLAEHWDVVDVYGQLVQIGAIPAPGAGVGSREMILVAGGTGMLGTKVVGLLRQRQLEVRVLTRDRSRAADLATVGVDIVEGDVRDPATVQGAVDGATTVVSAIHGFAGPNNNGSPATIDRDGNHNLIRAAIEAGAEHLVLLSVWDASPDHPMDLMRMKHAAEEELKSQRPGLDDHPSGAVHGAVV